MDRVDIQRDISRFLVDFAATEGKTFCAETLWKLPSPTGMRFATTQGINSSFIAELQRRANTLGLCCELRTTKVVPNLYEFDGEPYLPAEAQFLEFYPKPHCDANKIYLRERKVILELVEERHAHVLIPVAGKGPRLYSHDAIAKLAVTPENLCFDPDWPFPIDLVYTWVDSADPVWKSQYASHVDEIRASAILTASASAARWRSRDELRYSLRSVDMYAPFIRNIFIVTNGQKPRWLKDHPKVKVISHSTLYPDTSVLPSFNSNSIESVLHRIPDLAEHFLYLNDDFFFSNTCTPEDFFSHGGLSKLFFSKRFLDERPINPNGRATVACHKTTRDLLEAKFKISCAQKFQHAPHALRKSILEQIEVEFPADLARTRSNRVRSPDDLALALLFGYFSLYTGNAQKSRIDYAYIEIGTDDIHKSFADLVARKIKVFCLNDTDSENGVSEEEEKKIQEVLKERYPIPAQWEK